MSSLCPRQSSPSLLAVHPPADSIGSEKSWEFGFQQHISVDNIFKTNWGLGGWSSRETQFKPLKEIVHTCKYYVKNQCSCREKNDSWLKIVVKWPIEKGWIYVQRLQPPPRRQCHLSAQPRGKSCHCRCRNCLPLSPLRPARTIAGR